MGSTPTRATDGLVAQPAEHPALNRDVGGSTPSEVTDNLGVSSNGKTAGWLPAVYQGTMVRPGEPHILNLDAPPQLSGSGQQRQLELLNVLNKNHLTRHAGDSDLDARIQSYALAARMQHAAKEAFDLSGEPEHGISLVAP